MSDPTEPLLSTAAVTEAQDDVDALAGAIVRELDELGDELETLQGAPDGDSPELSGSTDPIEVSNTESDAETFEKVTRRACETLREAVGSLDAGVTDANRRYAFGAATAVTTLDSAVATFGKHLEEVANRTATRSRIAHAVNAVQNWLTRHLRPKIRKISQHLWNLVSGLTNPASWTVTGDTGINLLGLSGNVGLSVTFEP